MVCVNDGVSGVGLTDLVGAVSVVDFVYETLAVGGGVSVFAERVNVAVGVDESVTEGLAFDRLGVSVSWNV